MHPKSFPIHVFLSMTDTCMTWFTSSGYSRSKRIPIDSTVQIEGMLVLLQ